jgi:hypothetical protein
VFLRKSLKNDFKAILALLKKKLIDRMGRYTKVDLKEFKGGLAGWL